MSGVGNYQQNNAANKAANLNRAITEKRQYNAMASQLSRQTLALQSERARLNAVLTQLGRKVNIAQNRSSNLAKYIEKR